MDAYLWVVVACSLLPLLSALGAPLGEPVAEDFDFLDYALFQRHWTLLDGGGSSAFWRPLPHQIYYALLGRVILTAPVLIALLHAALLAGAGTLLYVAWRSHLSRRGAAFAASFPFITASARMSVSWPSHGVEIGLLFGSALALAGASKRNLLWTCLGSGIALLSKETAVVTTLGVAGLWALCADRRSRKLLATALLGAIVLAWAGLYWHVRVTAGLALPHHMESGFGGVGDLSQRMLWALGNSLLALVSMHAGSSGQQTLAVLVAVVLFGLLVVRRRRGGERGEFLARGVGALGIGWFLAASLALVTIYPFWAPNRAIYAGIGLGLALAVALERVSQTASWWILGARVAALWMSPLAPATIATAPHETGAFIDFQQLSRLQLLMRETRNALRRVYPRLPPHAVIVQHYFPLRADYAFGGSEALRVWYRDSTLTWMTFDQYLGRGDVNVVSIAEFQPGKRQAIALVDPAAMRLEVEAEALQRQAHWPESIALLEQARVRQPDSSARVFLASNDYLTAWAMAATGHPDSAEVRARRAVASGVVNENARYVLALILAGAGRTPEALDELDSLLAESPQDADALGLRGKLERTRIR